MFPPGSGLPGTGLSRMIKTCCGSPATFRVDVLNPFHDQRPGSAALYGRFGDAVNVRMIPIESGRLVQRKLHVVLKRLSGVDQGADHFILMAGRGRVGAVVVDVDGGGGHGHGAAGTRRSFRKRSFPAWRAIAGIEDAAECRDIVRQIDQEPVAGMHMQGRRLRAARGHETVKRVAVLIDAWFRR